MTQAKTKVLFVGALTYDTVFRVDDFSQGPGKYMAGESTISASGMAANAATAAARLGGDVALWASVGGDAMAGALIAEIEDEGVDCAHVRHVPDGRSASATIVVDATGERWVIVDYDKVTQGVPTEQEKPPIEHYAAVMADVRWPGAAMVALRTARAAGRHAILDADTAPLSVLENLAPCASHIVASTQGASILTGSDEPFDAAHKIANRYGCFVCVTNGAGGSFWTESQSSEVHHIHAPSVEAVDTNGAGDVFHGAFSQALAEGKTPKEAIQFASSAAALKCTVFGGCLGAPLRQATLKMMKATYHDL